MCASHMQRNHGPARLPLDSADAVPQRGTRPRASPGTSCVVLACDVSGRTLASYLHLWRKLVQMEDNAFNEDVLRVTDPEAAKVLTDTREWNLLSITINREVSLSELAHEMNMSLPALGYRVKKLLKLGLLTVSRIERRKGSPIKYYRATARHFFVPFEVTTFQSLAELLTSTIAPFERRMRHDLARVLLEEAGDWGMNFYGGTQGGFNFTFSPLPEQGDPFLEQSLQASFPAVHSTILSMSLDFDTAKALQRDLYEVYERYHERHVSGQQKYLLRVALVPVRQD